MAGAGAGVQDVADARAAGAGLPPVDSLNVWPMLAGENATSPRTEVPLSGGAALTGSGLGASLEMADAGETADAARVPAPSSAWTKEHARSALGAMHALLDGSLIDRERLHSAEGLPRATPVLST